jgi:hypothetical protein
MRKANELFADQVVKSALHTEPSPDRSPTESPEKRGIEESEVVTVPVMVGTTKPHRR